jgi:hypothetical protein
MEANSLDLNKRISKSETIISHSIEAQNGKIIAMANQINKLDNDVRVQVDRAIRDLESTDLRQ